MSSIYTLIRMAQVALKKAIIGLITFVITLGEHVKPKGKAIHCKSSPNHLKRKYLRESLWIGMWGKASFKSNPTHQDPGLIQSRIAFKDSIVNLYFLTHLLKNFKFRIGRNLPGDLGFGTAK